MPENLLAIDNGTQSVRALLFDPRGNLLYKSRVLIEPYFSTAPGLTEQDPEVFGKLSAKPAKVYGRRGWTRPGSPLSA